MLEVEVKLPVGSLEEMRTRLEAAGWTPRERLFERNSVYDTPDENLRRAGKLLRVRQTGGRGVLTVKLPTVGGGPHKVREEHNLDGPPETLEAVVESLGFGLAWRYEKYRTRYRKIGEAGVIELDETPIGVYLELEGPPEWIDRTSSALGFSHADYVTASYGDLFAAWQAKQAAPPRDMVFEVVAG